jgi:hypothetical protein
VREIPLTNSTRVALVDDDVYDEVMQYRWWEFHGYVRCTRTTAPYLKLEHFVMRSEHLTDHRNRNPLDNRRENLRHCTYGQNNANRVVWKTGTNPKRPYRGVKWRKRYKRWAAVINVSGKRHEIGRFKRAEDAARAYDDAARRLHCEFARLNFPRDGELSARAA